MRHGLSHKQAEWGEKHKIKWDEESEKSFRGKNLSEKKWLSSKTMENRGPNDVFPLITKCTLSRLTRSGFVAVISSS